MEIYRSIMAHDDTRLVRSRNQFMRMIDATTRGPMSHELFDRRDDEIHFVIRFIPEFLDRLMTKIIKDKSDYLLRKRVKFRPITKEQDASNKS